MEKSYFGWAPTVKKSKSVVHNFRSQLSIAWGSNIKISFSTECVAKQNAISILGWMIFFQVENFEVQHVVEFCGLQLMIY